ncbi:MAG: histidinol-phosphatase [Rikenellaceae bacterium]|nr:histidinol-phosphatase [Rikenellaceae bacterium]
MKRVFLILALAGLCFADAAAQKKIPETITFVQNAQRRTEIILPQVNGLNVYKADLHTHSIYSDAELTPEERVKEAWFDGLDIFAMTDHVEYRRHEPNMLKFLKGYTGGEVKKAVNSNVIRKAATEQGILADLNLPTKLAQKAAKAYGDALLIIPACEITREPKTIGHFNALFTTDNNAIYDTDPLQSLRNAKKQGALITQNHPGWSRKTCDITEFEQKAFDEKLIDGVEIMNGYWFYPKAMQRCVDWNLYMLGCTDIHNRTNHYRQNGYFRTMTLIFAKENTSKAIRKALEKGHTLAYSAGNIAGDAKLLQDFFKASVSYKFLSRGKKGAATYALTNTTSLDYKIRVGKRVYELPAFQTITISVSKNKDGQDKDITFSVTNMWEVGYKNPKIVLKATAK